MDNSRAMHAPFTFPLITSEMICKNKMLLVCFALWAQRCVAGPSRIIPWHCGAEVSPSLGSATSFRAQWTKLQYRTMPRNTCNALTTVETNNPGSLKPDSGDLDTELGVLRLRRGVHRIHGTMQKGLHMMPRSLVPPSMGAGGLTTTEL